MWDVAEDTTDRPRAGAAVRRAVLVTAWLGYAALGTAVPTLTWAATAATAVPAAAALVLAVAVRPERLQVQPPVRRAIVAWCVILAVGVAWEAWAFAQQPGWRIGSFAHPTLSTLATPVLLHWPVRYCGWLVWLFAGWRLVRP